MIAVLNTRLAEFNDYPSVTVLTLSRTGPGEGETSV